MNSGILIYAHNSKELDYSKLAVICCKLASKNLNLPVSVVVDRNTLEYVKTAEHNELFFNSFDKIITVDYEESHNYRMLYDGTEGTLIPFRNNNRCTAYKLTPYDKTLLIDCDFLILSDSLKKYFDLNEDLLFTGPPKDLKNRLKNDDIYVSPTGPELEWATVMMFTKSVLAEIFFEAVEYVQHNWSVLSSVYGYNSKTYRNDIAFSIARHIINNFHKTDAPCLESFIMTQDKDLIVGTGNNCMNFLIYDTTSQNYNAVSINETDIHVMNKQDLIRNFENLVL